MNKFITEIVVKDPDTGNDVHVEIWKHGDTEGVFGIDSSFLECTDGACYDPFEGRDAFLVSPELNLAQQDT